MERTPLSYLHRMRSVQVKGLCRCCPPPDPHVFPEHHVWLFAI